MSRGHACEIERRHGEWLVCTCSDATDECLVCALMSRTFSWGLAGFDVVGVAPKIIARCVDRGCSQRIETRNVDLECFSISRASVHATKKQRLLGDSVPTCALECNEKYLRNPSVRGIS